MAVRSKGRPPVTPTDIRAAKLPPASLTKRLLAAIEQKLKRIEERLQMDAETTAADSEREAREIGQLIRNYEKLQKLEADAANSSKGRSAKESGGDAEQWRIELAKRIERVREQWRAAGGAE